MFRQNNKSKVNHSNNDALKSIHLAGTWAIILGLVVIAIYPYGESLTYKQSQSNGLSKTTLVVTGLIVGLIVGTVLISFGIKLKRTTLSTIQSANRTLLYLAIIALIFMFLGLVSGDGDGLLNIVVLFFAVRARSQIDRKQFMAVDKARHTKTRRRTFRIIALIILVLAIVISIIRTQFKVWHFNGLSMLPNYANGQTVLATRSDKSPKIDDVVVFRFPDPAVSQVEYGLHRVVAVGGDRVIIKNGALTVYDNLHPNGYNPGSSYEPVGMQTSGRVNAVVPSGDVYVLGDNRPDSLDSRVFGPLPISDIVGKVLFKL